MSKASTQTFTYVVAIGSNRAFRAGLGPQALVDAAIETLDSPPLSLCARSRILRTRPLGPSRRTYDNAVAIIETDLLPRALLDHLHAIEARYGRRRQRRWGARTLDLDIILWSGGIWTDDRLTIPHPAFGNRDFVLRPLVSLAPDWRDPCSGHSIAHLHARLSRRKPVDQRARAL